MSEKKKLISSASFLLRKKEAIVGKRCGIEISREKKIAKKIQNKTGKCIFLAFFIWFFN